MLWKGHDSTYHSPISRANREELAARRAIAEQMQTEMRETLTVMLLSCELAMSVPDVPLLAAEKICTIDTLARTELASRSELIKSRAASGFALLCPTFRSDNVSLLIHFCERGIADNLNTQAESPALGCQPSDGAILPLSVSLRTSLGETWVRA